MRHFQPATPSIPHALCNSCVWRLPLQAARLFVAVGDARSALEADAYSSWMSGSFLLEKQVSWELALAKLTRAKCVRRAAAAQLWLTARLP